MILAQVLSVFALTTVGVYLLLRRRTFPVLLGVILLSHAANLMVMTAGGLGDPPPAMVGGGVAVDPVPQALVLTAIVISMAVTFYLVTILGHSADRDGIVRVDPLPEVEPGSRAGQGADGPGESER